MTARASGSKSARVTMRASRRGVLVWIAGVGHPTRSRLARLTSMVLRPTEASLKATVTSSSLRVSLLVTTMPSPQRAWRTRSPSRNWRSPGMIGRADLAGVPAAPGARPGRRPRHAPGARGSRTTRPRCMPRAWPPGRARVGTSRRPAARPVGRSPAGTRRRCPAPPPRTGVPNRLVRRAPKTRSRSRSRSSDAAELRPVHQLGRDLEQEPRRHRRLAHPPGRASPGVRQEEPLLGAGDADVGEAALLLELLLVVERPAVREEALLEPGDEDDRELEALRGVERDERHGVGVALVRILVGDERRLLEQAVERVVGRQVVVAGRDRAQLEQVRPALLAVLGAVGEHRAIAGRLEGLVEQLGECQHPDPGPQPPHERRELGQGVARPRRQGRELAGDRGLDRAPRRPALARGGGAQRLDGLVADPARRDVDDPLEADAVGVRAQDAQVGEGVLDLAPGVEPRARRRAGSAGRSAGTIPRSPGTGRSSGTSPRCRAPGSARPPRRPGGSASSRDRRSGPRPGGRSTRPPPPRCRPRSAGSSSRRRCRSTASCPCARCCARRRRGRHRGSAGSSGSSARA